MRKIPFVASLKKFATTIAGVLFLFVLHLGGAFTLVAQAETCTGSFLGAAGKDSTSAGCAQIPGSVKVTATVTVYRQGSDADFPQKLVLFELVSPTAGVVDKTSREISGSRVTFTLNGPPSGATSCAFWNLKVTNLDTGTPKDLYVHGDVTFSWDLSPRNLIVDPSQKFNLPIGNLQSRTFTGVGGGRLVIKGSWETDDLRHFVGYSLKLTMRLINPAGTRVAIASGFAQNAGGVSETDKLKIDYQVRPSDITPGKWKLEVIGAPDGNARDISITVVFTPGCG